MGYCALPMHSTVLDPLEEQGTGPLAAPGPQRSSGFHLIKLSHNENSSNEINFNYLSAADLRERLR